ncbi:MAG TPA: response regulator transcription factor [Blastocatellia bacterium]|nr:response regulator transcription factor [Blastocatellia bacterium]
MVTPATKPIRILLVDDHAVVRAGLRLIVQSREGMTIVGEAGNRDDALSLADSEHPDIILLDLDLGGDSGMTLIADLIAAAGEARIIILTGLRDPEAHRQAVLLGAMGIVKKEKAAEVLITAIERVHQGEAWLDPSLMAGVLTEVTRSSRGRKTDPEADKIATLTNREREVITLVGEGIKSKEIAGRLFISETTVRHHLTSIFDKLGVADRVELLIYAYRHGLASPPR